MQSDPRVPSHCLLSSSPSILITPRLLLPLSASFDCQARDEPPFYRHEISISTSFWSLLKVGRLTDNLNHNSTTSSSSNSSSPILKQFLSPILKRFLSRFWIQISIRYHVELDPKVHGG